MKRFTWLIVLLVPLLALALPGRAFAKGLLADKVVIGQDFVLSSGQALEGSLIVVGGNVTLEAGSRVNGDTVVVGGNLNVSGEIDGNLIDFGKTVSLASTALVTGDVTALGGRLSMANGARVLGNVNEGFRGPFLFNFPNWNIPQFQPNFSPIFDRLWFFFRTFLWAAIAVLVVLFLPQQTERTGRAALKQPFTAGALGLLTVVITPLVLVILAITILLIPVALVGALLLALAWMFGLVSLGYMVGKRLQELTRQEWAPAVAAALGTFLLVFVINGMRNLIPCIFWIVPAATGMVGLGAVILTRFGTQSYPPFAPLPPAGFSQPPAQYSPPAPPAPPASEPPFTPFMQEPPPPAPPGEGGSDA
jgi:cytoskeletal protein CcmA (bactofilin family)